MTKPDSAGDGTGHTKRAMPVVEIKVIKGVAARCRLALAACLLGLGAAAAAAAHAGAEPGDLDQSFSSDGRVATEISTGVDFANAVAIQADGKIVAAGRTAFGGGNFGLVRYNPDGSLDTTFAGNGKLDVGFGSNETAHALAIQDNGKLVVSGSTSLEGGGFALARLTADGSLDPSFGDGGRVFTRLEDPEHGARGLAIQPDGRIVAAGRVAGVLNDDFALARYRSDGSPDPSFGASGLVATDFLGDDQANALAIQADRRIVVAGSTSSGDGSFALARYRPDGSLDRSFGGDGRVTTDFSGLEDVAHALAIQPDGRIVAAGGELPGAGGFALARYRRGSSLDPSFGDGGKVVTELSSGGDVVYGVAIQPDGKILAAGTQTGLFVVLRYRANGTLDPSFGDGGRVFTRFSDSFPERANAVAIQPADSKIVAAGSTPLGDGRFALARYHADTRVTIRIRGRKLKLNRKGRTIAHLACPAAELSGPCAGTLKLKTRKKLRFGGKRRNVVLARRGYSIGAGEAKRVRLKLSKRTARLVRNNRRARDVRAIARVSDRAGNSARVAKRMRVKP